MRGLVFFCLVFINCSGWAQDTIFLERSVLDTPYASYHAIYIEKDTSSSAWKSVVSFAFNHYDSVTFAEQKKKIGQLNKSIVGAPDQPLRFVPLHVYKGKYYLYHPSDFYGHYRFELNNRYLLDFSGEGPYPNKVKQLTKVSKKHWIIQRSPHWTGSRVDIQWVDIEKGIVILSFSKNNASIGDVKYLMVDVQQAWRFPMIVNYCNTDRQPEVEFDKIDLEKLLRSEKTL